MKRLFYLLPLLFCFSCAIREAEIPVKQNDNLNYSIYEEEVKEDLSTYSFETPKIIHNRLLRDQMNEIFNNLIFGNDDLVANASAIGITVNEEKTNVNLSNNFQIFEQRFKEHPLFLRVGLSASGKGNTFALYTDNAWESKSQLTLGLKKKLRAYRTTELTRSEFDIDHKNRKLALLLTDEKKRFFGNDNVKKINDLIEMLEDDSADLKAESDAIKSYAIHTFYPALNKLLKNEDRVAASKLLSKIKKEQNILADTISTVKWRALRIDKYVDSLIYSYDKSLDHYSGHKIWWLDFDIISGIAGYSFEDENISYTGGDLSELRESNALNFAVTFNLNWSHESKKWWFYSQMGLGYQLNSALSSNLVQGTPQLITRNGSAFFVDEHGRLLGDARIYDERLQTADFHAYAAIMFTKSKNVGLSGTLRHEFALVSPEAMEYSSNLTALGGLIFKTKKGLTAGLEAGFNYAPYDSRMLDDFIARIRVGIPFNFTSGSNNSKSK
jgi:hypothetical protein